jgi:nicotinate-nucleotide pyrophosphorylase (carboxylating)
MSSSSASAWLSPEPNGWWELVEEALAEDVGPGDITSASLPADLDIEWYVEAQDRGVLCGVGITEYVMTPTTEDSRYFVEILKGDGEPFQRGDIIAKGRNQAQKVLQNERTCLNFLMMLSGVSTLTSTFVERVKGLDVRLVDTRKTVPGLRTLQKYAVRCGRGFNHRMGLFDAVMLKDNHIRAHGSIDGAVKAVRAYLSHTTKIEIECDHPEQVDQAVAAGADIVLLDNMDPFTMREIVKKYKGRVILEASGGINLETVRGVAETGVDVISVGAITHSAVSVPFHMELT